ncbi:hypothetical protein Mapa_013971 [Marchantia paleacea]|nr:hypothetical protein Mapa_013971 [Marchantia paleacea]
MVLVGQGMEPEEAFTKVQVVYYLSRGGQLQQPHLIDVPVSTHSNGLYLRDVKRRLTSIRGKGMGDSFSWSCKRNYKNNFIWQDLADDDKILPLSDGELVLKGSELYTGFQEKAEFMDGQFDPENASQLPNKIKKLASKKFDFEAVKRSLDMESDKLQEQSDLAAALSLSLQLMSDPHMKRFSKDKSMDLNQQVMNSLSQAKSNAAEECMLDHSVTDISSETLHSEESTVQKFSFNETIRERSKSTASASSSGTDREHSYGPPRKTESMGRERSLPRDLPRSREVSRELPPQIPREVPREKSREMSRELPREAPRDLPREAPRELPREVPRETSRELPREVPRETSRELPREGPREISREQPREVPREVVREVSRELPRDLSRDSSKAVKEAAKTRQEKPEELPTIKTKKSPTCSESGDSTPFMLSPRRLMAALSSPSPEKKFGKLVHSSSTRSSTPSTSAASTQCEDSLPNINIRLSKQATCLSNFRLCGNANPHATDSRPDSPEHPLSAPAQPASGAVPQSPNTRGHQGGPYWPRWRSARKPRTSSEGKEGGEPPTPPRGPMTVAKPDPPLKKSFEFDMNVSGVNSAMATPFLQTENNSPSSSESSNAAVSTGKKPASISLSGNSDASDGGNGASSTASSSSEVQNNVSVKEVITQQLPSPSSSEGRPSLNIDTASLPRVSISEAISDVRETVKTTRPDSPESPMKPNPPSSPVRTQLSSSPSFNKRIEDARARARSLVSKEIRSGESRSSKDLLKENDRAKTSSGSMRSGSTRTPNNKNGTTGAGSKTLSGTFNRSPPRINSIMWEDAPLTPTKKEFVNRDDRPLTAGRTNLDWEKTLQEAASLSLPPPDFGQILQECGQCGRTFKPDSLKVHMRGCHALRRSKDFQPFNGTSVAIRTRLQ